MNLHLDQQRSAREAKLNSKLLEQVHQRHKLSMPLQVAAGK